MGVGVWAWGWSLVDGCKCRLTVLWLCCQRSSLLPPTPCHSLAQVGGQLVADGDLAVKGLRLLVRKARCRQRGKRDVSQVGRQVHNAH